MKSLTIGQVAERAGIATSAIRYYEAKGLLPRAERRNGRRVYDEDVDPVIPPVDFALPASFFVRNVARDTFALGVKDLQHRLAHLHGTGAFV